MVASQNQGLQTVHFIKSNTQQKRGENEFS